MQLGNDRHRQRGYSDRLGEKAQRELQKKRESEGICKLDWNKTTEFQSQ